MKAQARFQFQEAIIELECDSATDLVRDLALFGLKAEPIAETPKNEKKPPAAKGNDAASAPAASTPAPPASSPKPEESPAAGAASTDTPEAAFEEAKALLQKHGAAQREKLGAVLKKHGVERLGQAKPEQHIAIRDDLKAALA